MISNTRDDESILLPIFSSDSATIITSSCLKQLDYTH